MLLSDHGYSRDALRNKTVLITGGGGGIGFEASRALSYMGAKVIIADIDAEKGERAEQRINGEYQNDPVEFFRADLSDEAQIDALYGHVMGKYVGLDVIIHNAAFVPMGAVDAVSISDWDMSYAVNLRAPVLLTQKFLPHMRENGGVIVFNPSAPGPFMSAYEIFKTAQVELLNTLSQELEGAGVVTFGVAPGFVKTDTAVKAVHTVATSMGISAEDFYETLGDIIVDAEIAGAGYAVSVANAQQYHGKETSAWQVLADHGLAANAVREQHGKTLTEADVAKLTALFKEIADVFYEQYEGWLQKPFFHKQFVLSDFKKQMGLPAENVKKQLEALQNDIRYGEWDAFLGYKGMFIKLKDFYGHQSKLLQGYEKDAARLSRDIGYLNHWIAILQAIIELI